MNTIVAIIATLSEDERKEFLLQAKRKTRRSDAKNGTLFKLLMSGRTKDLDLILYGKPAKNAYHALCKRLCDSLIDFVANKSFGGETSEDLELLKLLLASRIFFEQKEPGVGFKTLIKAEKKAKRTDLYAILNEIYHTKIQYVHLNPKLNLDAIIADSEENMRLLRRESQLNQAQAVIKAGLRKEGNLANQVISTAFSRFDIEIDQMLTYKSLFQLMEITATSAKLLRDFYSISPFMMELYEVVHKKDMLSDKHRYYHIKILNLMGITCFRNKKFDQSERFATAMQNEMMADNRKYLKRFSQELITLQALNNYYTGRPEKAFDLLEGFEGDSLDVALLCAMCLFQQNAFSKAYKILKEFNHSDDWYEKKMGAIWVLKKNIIEILVLIELDKLDIVLLRIARFKRRFSIQLVDLGEKRVLTFIEFVELYYENPAEVSSDAFKARVEHSFDWLSPEQEDIFVMTFYAWLKAKMNGENIYKVTLELVGRS